MFAWSKYQRYAKPSIKKTPNAEEVIIHTGTNYLNSDSTPTEIATNQYYGSCCWRKEKLKPIETENQQKAFNIIKELKELCTSKNIRCIEHGNIHPRNHLNRSKLHFNFHGNTLFLNNICKYWVKTRVMYIRKVRNLSQEKLVTPVKIFRPCWQIFLGKK